uniref:Uncharacterized protein n=1 Tax=Anguilla anguilla TaxID=7936 RepID=A0A0E9XC48_ANGAN
MRRNLNNEMAGTSKHFSSIFPPDWQHGTVHTSYLLEFPSF